jgi:hypothetical protein
LPPFHGDIFTWLIRYDRLSGDPVPSSPPL